MFISAFYLVVNLLFMLLAFSTLDVDIDLVWLFRCGVFAGYTDLALAWCSQCFVQFLPESCLALGALQYAFGYLIDVGKA